jgi:hypothetical protein
LKTTAQASFIRVMPGPDITDNQKRDLKMTRYITRVELHENPNKPTAKDYDNLHAAMEAKGFTRTIKSGEDIVYKLPTATYYGESSLTTADVLKHAAAAAKSVWSKYSVITSEAPNSAWEGLAKA